MKIVSPINNVDEAAPLIEHGAGQLYCGVFTREEKNMYTNVSSLNRYPPAPASFDNFGEIEKVVKIAHSYGVPVNFTLNCFYNEEDSRQVIRQVRDAINAGVDSLIVQDIGLLTLLKTIKNLPGIHIGTLGTTFNGETANFYKEMGASRVILERQMTLEEIQAVSKATDLELEVFILNARCRYVDGFCTFQHDFTELSHARLDNWLFKLRRTSLGRKMSQWLPYKFLKALQDFPVKNYACVLDYQFSQGPDSSLKSPFNDPRQVRKFSDSFFSLSSCIQACGCCGLYTLRGSGVEYLKIVGRPHGTQKKIKDLTFVKAALSLAESRIDRDEFEIKVRGLYKSIYSLECKPGFCYYPDNQ